MDPFSYLSVLLSIILGLAITQVLQGFRGLLLARTRVQVYWPVIVWAVLLLLIYVQSWWAMFGLRTVTQWTFPAFSIVLLQTVLEYMLAALVIPDIGERSVDLRQHYFAHTGWFFGLMIGLLATSIGKEIVIYGKMSDPVNTGFHLYFIVTSAIAIFSRRDGYHKTMAVLGLLAFVSYTLELFSRLR